MITKDFAKLHKLSFKNRPLLDLEHSASCFHCFYITPVSEIKEWTDDGQTAICPECGIDSLLPGEIGSRLIIKMSDRYFNYERD
jgi:hypothetical protein